MNKEIKVSFNKVFKDFNESKKRYRVALGGYGSGKSYNIALNFILKLSDIKNKGMNLLVVRGTEKSHRQSTYAELNKAINTLGLKEYFTCSISPLSIRNNLTGCSVAFRGVNDEDARERLKSLTFETGNLTDIWVEEATEILHEDYLLLDGRLRGKLTNKHLFYQMTLSLNPTRGSHWIKTQLWDNHMNDEVIRCHSTFNDNRFLDDAYLAMIKRAEADDEDRYRTAYLGEWGSLGGLILTNYMVERLELQHSKYDYVVIGQDFGFNHANAVLTVGFKDDEVFVLSEVYTRQKDTQEVISLCEGHLDKTLTMYCDSAEPDRITTWKKAGYKAQGVKKGKGSVNAGIDYLQAHKIHIDSACTNTIEEISTWEWTKDNKSGEYIDTPININDDAMASLRYAIEHRMVEVKERKMKSINKNLFF